MLFGSAGLALIYMAMGACYHRGVQGWPMLLLVLAAIGCYAMSLAPVTWVVISEIFPNRIRGAAMAVAVSSLWIACFILTYTFPDSECARSARREHSGFTPRFASRDLSLSSSSSRKPRVRSLEQIEREFVD